jgi:CRISPR-associated exonuclease Cas4
MFTEDELLPISALQHVVYCERQAALIHVERLWKENLHTVEGRHLHERVDAEEDETRGSRRILRGVAIRSFELGIAGVADVVELRSAGADLRPFPIEYKKGKPKRHRADEVQLCAQALCLEEMLGVSVPRGALFYGKPRRRMDVELAAAIRELTREATQRLREIVITQTTPPAQFGPKCRDCSLLDICRPKAAERSALTYLTRLMQPAART